jgi:hypothetical protein
VDLRLGSGLLADDYAAIVARLRGWGFRVVEWDGCYGRSNGSTWPAGRPIGHVNHHYVCSLNPDQDYIDQLVANLAAGKTVQWFDDVHGAAYLIGVGPMNHAGTGNQSVLDRTRVDQAPPSNPAAAAGSISGNPHYSGTELQHPGDSTPYPGPMLDTMVAINAATFLQFGYTANRAIMHSEWSNRKVDLSAGGGVNSDGWSAAELRRRVAARMTGTPTDWFDMATEDDLRRIIGEELDARSLTPAGINDLVANVHRADEFKLDAARRAEDTFRAVTDVMHSPEFDLGATRRDTAATKADTTAILSALP